MANNSVLQIFTEYSIYYRPGTMSSTSGRKHKEGYSIAPDSRKLEVKKKKKRSEPAHKL